MQKADLVTDVVKMTGVERVAVLAVIDAAMATIKKANSKGEAVYLRGFGTFGVKTAKKKKAQNISQGKTIVIPAKKVMFFKASRMFKDLVKLLPVN